MCSSSWDQITQVQPLSLCQMCCSPDSLLPKLTVPRTHCFPDALLSRCTAPQTHRSPDTLIPRLTAPQTRWHSGCSDLTSVLCPKTPAPQLCYIPASCFPNSVFYRSESQGRMKHYDSLLPPNASNCEFTINPCVHPCIQQSTHAPTQACMYPLIQPPSSPLSNRSTTELCMYPALFPLLIGHLLILPTPHDCPPHAVCISTALIMLFLHMCIYPSSLPSVH